MAPRGTLTHDPCVCVFDWHFKMREASSEQAGPCVCVCERTIDKTQIADELDLWNAAGRVTDRRSALAATRPSARPSSGELSFAEQSVCYREQTERRTETRQGRRPVPTDRSHLQRFCMNAGQAAVVLRSLRSV